MRPEVFVGKDRLIDWFINDICERFVRVFGQSQPEYVDTLRYVGSIATELISNTSALYHDIEHTMMVVLCGQEIIFSKYLEHGDVTPRDWLNFMVSLLCHDVGYVKGVCPGDVGNTQTIDLMGNTVEMPPGATDAFLTPYHVKRGELFVLSRFSNIDTIDIEKIVLNIRRTEFPGLPTSQVEAASYPGLTHAADLIGQLADPEYLRKIPALFYEFQEVGTSQKMGLSHPNDLRKTFPSFFWGLVHDRIKPAMKHLKTTRQGRAWLSSLFSHIFVQEKSATLSKDGEFLLRRIAMIADSSINLREAIRNCLREVCQHTGWPVGHCYAIPGDGEDELMSTGVWPWELSTKFNAFKEVSEQTTFAPGMGLPGRVLSSGRPAWIVDVTKDDNFPRAKLADNIGIKAGLAFPIKVGGDVIAVLEFFSEQAAEPDQPVLEFMAHIGDVLAVAAQRHGQADFLNFQS